MTVSQSDYEKLCKEVLSHCAAAIEQDVMKLLSKSVRLDRVCTRVKSFDRLLAKAEGKLPDGSPKYTNPWTEIQDFVGLRVIVLFLEDVAEAREILRQYFRVVEYKEVRPADDTSFKYFGFHSVAFIPDEHFPQTNDPCPVKLFEIQIKTVFQHAWSEAEHDIGYKPMTRKLNANEIRTLGFAASLSWGADKAFQEVVDSLKG